MLVLFGVYPVTQKREPTRWQGAMLMIYFDNAATTMDKPDEVVQAVARALTTFGGPGRGVHGASMAAAAAVWEARESAARIFDAPQASRVAFGANATWALNVAIAGLLPDGGRALTTAASHNSVLRPLFRARDMRGCAIDVAPIAADGALDLETYGRLLDRKPDIVVATHASNVTGDVYDVRSMAEAAHGSGALFVLDVAQTAGSQAVSCKDLGVDVLCFTGHKSLFGPQGTGGLVVADGVEIAPPFEGGTGVRSFDERQPPNMPESLEAGTANAHGLAGLAAGIEYVESIGVGVIAERVAALTARFEAGAAAIGGMRVLGGAGSKRSGIVAVVSEDVDAAVLAEHLWSDFGICVRAGAHCAPLMHRALGTAESEAVRFSFSCRNTPDEVDAGLNAIEHIVREVRRA